MVGAFVALSWLIVPCGGSWLSVMLLLWTALLISPPVAWTISESVPSDRIDLGVFVFRFAFGVGGFWRVCETIDVRFSGFVFGAAVFVEVMVCRLGSVVG